ncbi:type II toxin-antitoxin system Phd/YefM family antitoxin [Sphaerospermopsis kisseleviana CS-549]|uniref:Antitoxin n=1 Tax=Sphaerospermopsis kisseleviana CS-549 TaxID=3021783 RepID=A0ABT4ZXU3_9CYAN|nr:type II toxin-antitoxin system Phd/YefM family antitoxin [Sphaerospermopsis kisseleviana]MDB9444242.1 type II toxin-antitoxin system Phd/YefM family antitoxin [Sphaerospermopsis kisseleviana CS-549]BAZ79414.1 prevent-host-death family protein [Sphaerospermopsis kisseleviana NIES-73]
MINLSRDIQSLSTFKRNTNELITQMKETGNPVVLTVNGKAELVVQDAAAYQKLLDTLEKLETLIGIKKGLEDIETGNTQSLDQFIEEMQKKQ